MGRRVELTPEKARMAGTNLRRSVNRHPHETRLYLVGVISQLCNYIQAKITLTSEEDIYDCVREIEREFVTLNVEEIKCALDRIKTGAYGKLYERLQMPELLDAIRQYEREYVIGLREKQHQMKRDSETMSQMFDTIVGPEEQKKALKAEIDAVEPLKGGGEGLGSRLRKKLS